MADIKLKDLRYLVALADTRHFPLWVFASNCWKALAWSFETTPVREYCGNFCPIPSMSTP
jgi:hypothetical protein